MRQRSIFIFNFTRQIGWPEPFETFKIGILGDDPVIKDIERNISRGRLVQGRPVEVQKFSVISNIQDVQLIYVNEKYGHDINKLLSQVKGKGILIISENYPFGSSMINMVLVNGAFEFEVQQNRLEEENFKLTSYFKDVAITSANRWQALYQESAKNLQEERKSLEAEKKKVADQMKLIQEQQQTINNQSQRISAKSKELQQLQTEYDETLRRSQQQENLYQERTNQLKELENRFNQTRTAFNDRQQKIDSLDTILKSKQDEIATQSSLIDDQKTTLELQQKELATQQTIILLSVGTAFFALIAVFFIWKNNRQKKQSNFILERKNKEIEATSEELKKVNKEMEQFASLASHDLQEPLNTITGWLRIINKDQLDKDGQMSLDLIDNATHRMRGLIQGLLEYSKLGSSVELTPVDCNLLLEDVKNNLTRVIEDKDAQLEIGKLPIVQGHQLKLSMLFQNLISNALKFTKPDISPKVKVTAKKSDNNGYWEFLIKDNGIGIAEKNISKVFDIFHREHSQNKYEGTGIGLAHVRKIVELHNGKIWVESTLGEGTTFHFTLQSV